MSVLHYTVCTKGDSYSRSFKSAFFVCLFFLSERVRNHVDATGWGRESSTVPWNSRIYLPALYERGISVFQAIKIAFCSAALWVEENHLSSWELSGSLCLFKSDFVRCVKGCWTCTFLPSLICEGVYCTVLLLKLLAFRGIALNTIVLLFLVFSLRMGVLPWTRLSILQLRRSFWQTRNELRSSDL